MASVLRIVSNVSFVLAILSLILVLVFYRKYDIKGMLRDSKTRKNALKNKSYDVVESNTPLFDDQNYRSNTRKIHTVENNNTVNTNQETQKTYHPQRSAIEENESINEEATTLLQQDDSQINESTTILNQETTILNEGTTILNEATTVLSQDSNSNNEFGIKISDSDSIIGEVKNEEN